METYETSLFQTQGGAAHSSSSSEKLLVSAPTSPRASESHAGARRSTRRESQTEFAAAFDDEDTAQQKNPGPKPPPLAGYHGYESLNYDHIYNTFQMEDAIARQSHTKETLICWLLTLVLGILLGLLANYMEEAITAIVTWRSNLLRHYYSTQPGIGFVYYALFNLALMLLACIPTLFFAPEAAGSGIPEVKAYLNGVNVKLFMRMQTLIAKVWGTILAVASGLAIGPEGPLVHIGATLGSGLTRGPKKIDIHFMGRTWFSLDIKWDWLSAFHTDADRRDFISIGAGTGFAAAFGAPVGGVLFALEETCSFWSFPLMWRTLISTTVACFMIAFCKSGFEGTEGFTNFGLINLGYTSDTGFRKVWELFPYALMGFLGGVLGAAWVSMWHALSRWRPKKPELRVLEVIAVSLLTSALTFGLPFVLSIEDNCKQPCRVACPYNFGEAPPPSCPIGCQEIGEWSKEPSDAMTPTVPHRVFPRDPFDIANGTGTSTDTYIFARRFNCPEGEYNGLAMIFLGVREDGIKSIMKSARRFNTASLYTGGIAFYFLMLFGFGTGVPAGLFLPTILTGCMLGGGIGNTVMDIFGDHVHPGPYALLMAVGLLGGIQRSSISLVIIILEGTGQISYLLPTILVMACSIWVSNHIHEGIYHTVMHIKGFPFLEPHVHRWMKCWEVRHVMTTAPIVFDEHEKAADVLATLASCTHNGFPVVRAGKDGKHLFLGLVLRSQLHLLLKAKQFATAQRESTGYRERMQVPPRHIHDSILAAPSHTLQEAYGLSDEETTQLLDIGSILNRSPFTVRQDCPLSRTQELFTSMGLRHLVVLDHGAQIVGIVTRQNLLNLTEQSFVGQTPGAALLPPAIPRGDQSKRRSTLFSDLTAEEDEIVAQHLHDPDGLHRRSTNRHSSSSVDRERGSATLDEYGTQYKAML